MTATKNKRVSKKKYFSVKQVQSLLPRVESVLSRTITLNKALDLLSSIEIEVYEDDYDNLKKVTKMNKQFHKLSFEFYANIEQLEELGCVIKDLESGIVDFYSVHEGKEIFLCWKIGEKKIEFYHEIDDGYVGRKPLQSLRKH